MATKFQVLFGALTLLGALTLTPGNANATACDPSSAPDMARTSGSGWGIDLRNTRFQPSSALSAANARHLQLKWAYGLGTTTPRFYPLVTGDTIFLGDDARGIVALDRASGCERWVFEHRGQLASAIVPARVGERSILVFTDRTAGVFAIDSRNGALVWQARATPAPVPWYSGTPVVADNRVFVPLSSFEVALAVNPLYGCCTTSGGVAALDLATGNTLWYRATIEEPPQQTGRHYLFVETYGPSGAAVWGTPSYDPASDTLFFGTGQNYSHPTTSTSDALFAVNGTTGEVRWHRQFTANDAYTAACNVISLDHPNCPKPLGPDVDFGAPTMLVQLGASGQSDAETLLIGGQKSAQVHAVNPTTGAVRWSTRLGRGGIIGGVHWGMAANEALSLLYVPISDKALVGYPAPGEPRPGLFALDIATGETRWRYQRQNRCEEQACVFGFSAAITAANNVVVAGSIDGYLEVLHAQTGERLWVHDAWRSYDTINGVPASGGGFDAHGPVLFDDLLVVNAGYSYVGEQRGGNALLVFQIGDEG